MRTFDGAQIAAATGGVCHTAGPAGAIVTDTRKIQPGDWFLALVGDRFDGHDFLDVAAAAGAAGCVVEREPGPAWTAGIVQVLDTTRALQDLGRSVRAGFVGPVVALTGSSGKTTTRALIALAVAPLGVVHQTSGNLNNHFGVPMTLLATPPDADVLVIEMGTSSPGEIAVLADIAVPDVRLIVNVGPAHLEELGGLPGVAREKGALFDSARAGDVCCVLVDDPYIAKMALPEGVRVVTWGVGDADVRLLSAEVQAAQLATAARFGTPEGEVDVTIPAPGRHVALDAAGAIAVAVSLGVDPIAAARSLAGYAPVGMRMNPVRLLSGALVLNDAYNANPQSMIASLDVLASLPGRRVAVLGDMLELGEDAARWHTEVVAHAVGLGLERVLLFGGLMRAAAAGSAVWFDGPEAVAQLLQAEEWLGVDDVVLLKGSRGAAVERVLTIWTDQEGR